ncbi:MAG: ABC transporter permease [candidate division KSB1 bacterium]|nr:ABC transporter permease [candidate division KSB1 bacterium]MDZ7364751.1 ABC transporter permease [candidate division KSB1 bacterium]MDZ7402501.1 ABC transporter permease [candidate division KSB1 bacterium]
MFRHRIFHFLLLLLGIWVLNFFMIRLSPGDASNLYWGPQTTRQSLESLRQQRGLEQPLLEQFTTWSTRFLRGDLGYSWTQHRPVRAVLADALPATLQLAFFALLVNFLLGCLWGVVIGVFSSHWAGRVLNALSLIVYSMPTFWLAMIFILLFSLELQWLPPAQMQSLWIQEAGFWRALFDRLQHLILPVAVLGLAGAAATSRYLRGQMMEVLQQDYIRLAQAKGLSRGRIIFRHAFKNALLPVVTLLGLYFPFLLSGAFVVEVIFAWPGMGRVAYEALFAKDYPVIFAVNFIAATTVILGNLLADVLYQVVDPRTRA